MSHLSPALARRIDRLARRAHAFHRFAHHPLCPGYAGEVVRLGHRGRVCLGCSLATLGGLAGLGLGLSVPALPGAPLAAAAILLVLATPLAMPRRAPPAGPAGPHLRKLATRLLPTLLCGALLGQGLGARAPLPLAAAALGLGAVALGLLRYRRRGPDRSACQGCPDGPPGLRCPGFAPVGRRERAMSRLAGRWIDAEQAPAATPPSRPPPAASVPPTTASSRP